MKSIRKKLTVLVALAAAFFAFAFVTPSVYAAEVQDQPQAVSVQPRAAGGYASTWNPVSGQGNFTLTPSGYSGRGKLTLEATNSNTSTIYVAVTSNYNGRTIWAGFLPEGSLKYAGWFNMVNGETYNVYYSVVNGSAVVTASLWSLI